MAGESRTDRGRDPQICGGASATVRRMFLLDVACQALLLTEIAVALYFLHLPLRPGSALSIEAAGRAVRLLGGWMPARIGADEGGAAAAFAALGLPTAAGLALALTRRFRDILASLIGVGGELPNRAKFREFWRFGRMPRCATSSSFSFI
jgi:hypothetical protein